MRLHCHNCSLVRPHYQKYQCSNCGTYGNTQPFRTLFDLIKNYITMELSKDLEELKEIRLAEGPTVNEPMIWKIDLIFGDKHVTYTRVVSVQVLPKIRFISHTQATRLWVPLGEVPIGAEVHLSGETPSGPFVVYPHPNWTEGAHTHYHLEFAETGDRLWFGPMDTVECTFCYTDQVGFEVGGVAMVSPDDLSCWNSYPGGSIMEMVTGCKFDAWAAVYAFWSSKASVFEDR